MTPAIAIDRPEKLTRANDANDFRSKFLTPERIEQLKAVNSITNKLSTPIGLLSDFGPPYGYERSDLEKMSNDNLRHTLIWQLTSHFCNEDPSLFQPKLIWKDFPLDNDEGVLYMMDKLSIVHFLLKAKIKTAAELKQMTTAQHRETLISENYFHTGIPYQFFNDPPAGAAYQFIKKGMTDKELVLMGWAWYSSKRDYVRYNEITSAMAHDSHTGNEYKGSDGAYEMYKDQDRTILEQLRSGIRTVRISSSSGADLRHSKHDFGTLQDYLIKVREFLIKEAPYDIFTIIDEAEFSDTVRDVYQRIAGDLLFTPGQKGMPSLKELKAGKWPTLKAMVNAGKRIVMMSSDIKAGKKGTPPWHLCSYDHPGCLVSMDRDDYKLYQGIDPLHNPYVAERPAIQDVRNSNELRYYEDNYLYLLNHYFYYSYGVINSSRKAYSNWGVGEHIIEYAMLAWSQTKRKPNYLNVDYYDLQGDNNYLFDLVKAMNSPHVFGPSDIPFAIDREIKITNTHLVIGGVYMITNWSTYSEGSHPFKKTGEHETPDPQNLKMTVDKKDLSVKMCKTIVNENEGYQYWMLMYNTSSCGIRFVNLATAAMLAVKGRQQKCFTKPFEPTDNGDDFTDFEIAGPGPYVIRKSFDCDANLEIEGTLPWDKQPVSIARKWDNTSNQYWCFHRVM
jgi:hypothetical protein